jgi:hypothetical protein
MEKFKKMWKNLESSNSEDQIRERIKETKKIIKDGTSSVSDNWIFLIILKNQLAILEDKYKEETNNFIVLDNGDGTYTLLKKGDSGTYKAVETK